MTRLIDADKLIDDLSDLKRSPWANTPYASDQRKLGIIEALDMVQSIVRVDSQTVDAVPVDMIKGRINDLKKMLMDIGEDELDAIWDFRTRIETLTELLEMWAERKEE